MVSVRGADQEAYVAALNDLPWAGLSIKPDEWHVWMTASTCICGDQLFIGTCPSHPAL